MTIQQMIWRAKDADLIADLASYRRSIEANQMPEMIPHWQEAANRIEHEMEQRHLLAANVPSWGVLSDEHAPF